MNTHGTSSHHLDTSLTTVCVLVVLLAIAGNFSLLLTLYRTPSLRTNPNILVASLAVSNLVVGVVGNVMNIFSTSNTFVWLYIHLVPALNIFALSMDRYLVIIHGFAYQRLANKARYILIVLFIWVFSAITGVALSMVEDGKANHHIHAVVSIFAFFFPLLVISFCYSNITRAAYRHIRNIAALVPAPLEIAPSSAERHLKVRKEIPAAANDRKAEAVDQRETQIPAALCASQENTPTEDSHQKGKSSNGAIPHGNEKTNDHQDETLAASLNSVNETPMNSRQDQKETNTSHGITPLNKHRRRENKAAKTFALVSAVYTLSYAPCAISNIVFLAHGYRLDGYSKSWLHAIMTLGSALDPVIYAAGITAFRKRLKQMVPNCFRSTPESAIEMNNNNKSTTQTRTSDLSQ